MHSSISKLFIAVSLLLIFQVRPALSQVSKNLYTPDARLYESMDKAFVDKLSTDQSELIPYYNYFIDNSYYVVSLKAEKPVTGNDIHTVLSTSSKTSPGKLFSEKEYIKGKFNPLKYNFTRALDGFTTYVWKEAGVALVFYPERHFQMQFNEYLKEQNLNK